MSRFELVHRTAVVDVLLAGFLFGHQLAGDQIAAVSTATVFCRIDHFPVIPLSESVGKQ